MRKYLLTALGLSALFVLSCHKGDEGPELTGTTLLRTITMHHSSFIDSCMVYIKYNTLDIPTDGIYDDSMWVADSSGIPVATFGPLPAGNYYLYGYGYDPSIAEIVKGGTPLVIPALAGDTSTSTADTIIEVVVPVTED